MSANTVLITGGPSGIGRAITEAVLKKGWTAIAVDLSADVLKNFKEELAEFGDRLICEELDVSDEEAVVALINKLEAGGQAITGVVNSAGIGADIPSLETPVDLFTKILQVNLIGSFVVAREAARHMVKRGRGSIVNVASVSGIMGNSGRVAYGASKGGLLQVTRVMATEWAPLGLRVNTIAPGPVETPLVAQMHTTNSRAAWEERVPMHRYAKPEELAGAALFLLDDTLSGYMTGQTLAVDGGFTVAGLMYENEAV